MARGHVQGPASDMWERDRTSIPGPWPEVLVRLDLAYWSDAISCAGRPRPSMRRLAESWGWAKDTARRFIRAWDAEACASDAPVVRQSCASEAAPAADRSVDVRQPCASDAPAVRQPLVDTRARSSLVSRLSDEDTSSERESPKPSRVPSGWEPVAEVYQTVFRASIGLKPIPKLDPTKGKGRELATLIKRHGAEAAIRLLRWWATSPKRDFHRSKQLDLKSVLKHADDSIDLMDNEATPSLRLASPSRQPDPPPGPPPDDELPTEEDRAVLLAAIRGRHAS